MAKQGGTERGQAHFAPQVEGRRPNPRFDPSLAHERDEVPDHGPEPRPRTDRDRDTPRRIRRFAGLRPYHYWPIVPASGASPEGSKRAL